MLATGTRRFTFGKEEAISPADQSDGEADLTPRGRVSRETRRQDRPRLTPRGCVSSETQRQDRAHLEHSDELLGKLNPGRAHLEPLR